MHAVEFQATITNGHIEIPAEYRGRFGEHVRVIVMAVDARSTGGDFIDHLLEQPARVAGFHPLSRDDAYSG